MRHYAKKIDANQKEIVEALRGAGYFVKDTHQFPGMLDIHVPSKNKYRTIVPIEIKQKGEPLTESEISYLTNFPGFVVYTAEEALAIMFKIDQEELYVPPITVPEKASRKSRSSTGKSQ